VLGSKRREVQVDDRRPGENAVFHRRYRLAQLLHREAQCGGPLGRLGGENEVSVTKIRGTQEGEAVSKPWELKVIAPWAIIGSLTHRFVRGEPR
jgi:hypothetical protein